VRSLMRRSWLSGWHSSGSVAEGEAQARQQQGRDRPCRGK
jgi:hypothetical protein